MYKLQKDVVRKNILDGKPRIDGRDNETVRSISIEVGILPKTHGRLFLLEEKPKRLLYQH